MYFTASVLEGHSNYDGDVDADDLFVWEDQCGEPGHLSGINAVP